MRHHKASAVSRENVRIGPQGLPGKWSLPGHALGIVVFSHCSGSQRQSARNQQVAQLFHSYGLGTLLFDLPSAEAALQQDPGATVSALAERVQEALLWVQDRTSAQSPPLGIFASNIGAAAALVAAAWVPGLVAAIVCRGGRPDMAGRFLVEVGAPTLMLVGAKDPYVLAVNRACQHAMTCESELKIVPRATHLFEELGTLETVAALAAEWFLAHFNPPGSVPVEDLLLRR